MCTPLTAAVGLAGGPVTEPCPAAPGGEAPGEAQDAAATDSSTHPAASRTLVPLSGPISDRRSIMAGISHKL
jgi:hypothetical protein